MARLLVSLPAEYRSLLPSPPSSLSRNVSSLSPSPSPRWRASSAPSHPGQSSSLPNQTALCYLYHACGFLELILPALCTLARLPSTDAVHEDAEVTAASLERRGERTAVIDTSFIPTDDGIRGGRTAIEMLQAVNPGNGESVLRSRRGDDEERERARIRALVKEEGWRRER
eukprot:2286916-Rhodomonas_salina.2